MKTSPILLLLCANLCLASGDPETKLDARLRSKLDLSEDRQSLRSHLALIADRKALSTRADQCFAELGDDAFAVRQAAITKLNSLPYIPEESIERAKRSGRPEIAMHARKLGRLQTDPALATEIALFTCLRTIRAAKVGDLVPELLAVAPNCRSAPAKHALLAALAASASTAEDHRRVREAAADPATRKTAEAYLRWRNSDDSAPPPAPGWHEFFDAQVMNGNGEGGHKTEFIKGIPVRLLPCFQTRTRTASTISSVSDRRRESPWLYPQAQWGEIPKVLEEKDQRHYPLWGTWRQNWTRSSFRLDENGSLIEGEHSGENNIHVSSSVQFLIVTLP